MEKKTSVPDGLGVWLVRIRMEEAGHYSPENFPIDGAWSYLRDVYSPVTSDQDREIDSCDVMAPWHEFSWTEAQRSKVSARLAQLERRLGAAVEACAAVDAFLNAAEIDLLAAGPYDFTRESDQAGLWPNVRTFVLIARRDAAEALLAAFRMWTQEGVSIGVSQISDLGEDSDEVAH